MENLGNFTNNNYSLIFLADALVSKTRKLLQEAKSEEDLKIGFEKMIKVK